MIASRRDGGYGWVIVFSLFLSEVVLDGIRFSFGMVYVEWLQFFNTGKGETAWIGSVMVGVYNIGGPLFVVIVNKLGCRVATILGALLSTAGFVLSFFASDIYFLYISYGILPGLGFGIVMLAGTVSVGRYFFNRRALAMGLAYSGSGIGMMIFNPAARIFLDTYGWRGTMFVYAGFALNLCVLGSLHRPFITEIEKDHDIEDVTQDKFKVVLEEEAINYVNKDEARTTLLVSDSAGLAKEMNGAVSKDDMKGYNGHENSSGIINGLAWNFIKNEKETMETQSMLEQTDGHIHGQSISPICRKTIHDNYLKSQNENLKQMNHMQTLTGSNNSLSHRKRPEMHLRQHETQINGSLTSISSLNKTLLIVSQNMFGSNASFEVLFEKNTVQHKVSERDNNFQKDKKETKWAANLFCTLIKNVFPKDLMSNINFNILMLATFFFGTAAYIPVALLPDYCLYVGCRIGDTGWLISTFGVTGIASRLVAGWLTDLPCVNRLVLFMALILIIGVASLLCPLLQSFELLMGYAAIVGFAMGAVYVVQPMLLFEYFGEEYLAEIVGIMMLNYGVSSLIGTPIAGWLFDGTGDYNVSFLFAGACCLVSVFLHVIVLCSKRTSCSSRKHSDSVQHPT